ncbi:MAG: hypothetical protein NZL87_07845 [Thermomicrobium sp.]|nr:hypothetical protein [Thermomicrobium sp.]
MKLYGPLVPKIDKPAGNSAEEERKAAEEAARRARAEAQARAGRASSILTGEVDTTLLGGRPRVLGASR